jgi:two-component system, OmpR family, sensor kinase
MHSILRTLPIRWQITVLHTTILALILAAGSVLLWQAQRKFQLDSLITRHTTEARALIPNEVDPKVKDRLFVITSLERAKLKELYPQIIAEIFPPNQDPNVSYKKLSILNPKLADKLFPPDMDPADMSKQLAELLPKLGAEDLFPPDENSADVSKQLAGLSPTLASKLFDAPQLDPIALRKWAESLVYQLSAKDRGALILAFDGAVLAQSSFGPSCSPAPYVSKAAFGAKANDPFFKELSATQYFSQVDQGQLTLLLPMIWQPEQGRPIAMMQLCVPTDSIDTSLNQLAASLVVGWVLVVGMATTLGVTATRRVLRPLDQVVATTGRIAAGDLKQRVGLPPGRTEIAQLGAAFDAMVARLEQAFAAQRRFVADAAHELRTPLTALSASVELLLMGAADNDRATAQRLLRHLDSELSRVIRLTNDLLMLSRLDARPQLALRPTDLSTLIEELGEQSRTLLRGQELIVDAAPGLWVQGDSDRLRQVMLNLLDNARKYTPPSGQIMLRAYPDDRPPNTDDGDKETRRQGDTELGIDRPVAWSPGLPVFLSGPSSVVDGQSSVVVEVEDTGVGIPADALSHLFERFYRVDSARARVSGGSGLGLAIVRAIILAHHGQVDVQSAPGVGTCVTIRLPRPSAPPMQDHVASMPRQGLAE